VSPQKVNLEILDLSVLKVWLVCLVMLGCLVHQEMMVQMDHKGHWDPKDKREWQEKSCVVKKMLTTPSSWMRLAVFFLKNFKN